MNIPDVLPFPKIYTYTLEHVFCFCHIWFVELLNEISHISVHRYYVSRSIAHTDRFDR